MDATILSTYEVSPYLWWTYRTIAKKKDNKKKKLIMKNIPEQNNAMVPMQRALRTIRIFFSTRMKNILRFSVFVTTVLVSRLNEPIGTFNIDHALKGP